MRYLKLASNENPETDFIELNDFNGFLCTSFQTLGISRELEFLSVKNRNFAVSNKPKFKKYSLTIEILSKYSEYEAKHRQLITFLDRNKKSGFRLYFRPYKNEPLRYCLCDIETSVRVEKMQPILLTLSQGSLWFGVEKTQHTSKYVEPNENMFAFQGNIVNSKYYYSAGFFLDQTTNEYCVEFSNDTSAIASITNESYNEIPLKIRIYGPCDSPIITLFNKDADKDKEPIRKTQILANIAVGYYLEINADIKENGVWYVNKETKETISYNDKVNNEYGSPYFYIDNGAYEVKIVDASTSTVAEGAVVYQEEYSE